MPRLLMTISEAAQALAISKGTVYALIKEGKLHLVHPRPRTSRIRIKEVLALAEPSKKHRRAARKS